MRAAEFKGIAGKSRRFLPGRMEIGKGIWWGLLREDERGKVWARLADVADTSPQAAYGCYSIAYFYWRAGILAKVCSTVILEREESAGGPMLMDVEALDREGQASA